MRSCDRWQTHLIKQDNQRQQRCDRVLPLDVVLLGRNEHQCFVHLVDVYRSHEDRSWKAPEGAVRAPKSSACTCSGECQQFAGELSYAFNCDASPVGEGFVCFRGAEKPSALWRDVMEKQMARSGPRVLLSHTFHISPVEFHRDCAGRRTRTPAAHAQTRTSSRKWRGPQDP